MIDSAHVTTEDSFKPNWPQIGADKRRCCLRKSAFISVHLWLIKNGF
jgi:hypothetical protein